jgi:hypothetical protein
MNHIVIWTVIATIGLGSLAAKLWDLRRNPGNQALRWLCTSIAAMTLSYTGQNDHIRRWVDAHTTPGFDWVVANCFALVAALAVQAVYMHTTDPDVAPRKVRTRAWATAAVVVLVVVLFVITESNYVEFTAKLSTPQEVPAVGPHSYLYTMYLGVVVVGVMTSASAYSRVARRFCLRLGLRLMVAGTVLCAVYCVVKLAMMAGYQFGLLPPGSPFDAGPGVFYRVAMPLVLIGAVLPAWGPVLGIERLAQWCADVLALRRLNPLWAALTRAVPEVVLDAPGRRRGPDVVLYRRAIEIWDARLRLRPFLDEAVAESARTWAREAGLPADRVEPTAEAAVLAVALAARAARVEVSGSVPPVLPPDADLGWLVRVAREFVRSPLVARAVAVHGRQAQQPA